MTENKRFVMYGSTLYEMRNNNKVELMPTDCFCLLSELTDENEQLKEEIKDLNDVLARYEEKELKRMTDHEKSCGYCKHFEIDGMFGLWCEKKHNWEEVKYCEDFER